MYAGHFKVESKMEQTLLAHNQKRGMRQLKMPEGHWSQPFLVITASSMPVRSGKAPKESFF